ncbi:saccharopine dehydrogenase, partial [Streptomyces erythrochromogenes]
RTLGVAPGPPRVSGSSPRGRAGVWGGRGPPRRPPGGRAGPAAFSRVHLGGDGFAVRADARRGDLHAAWAVTGRVQSRVTALVAAYVTRELLTGSASAGVHHIEQLPALAGLPEALGAHGLTVWDRHAAVLRT